MFNFSEDFIKELIKKDSQCFNKFYMESVDIFYRYLKGNHNLSEGDSQDLISTLYLKIWNGLDNYKETSNFSSWVWTIFRNIILDHFKLDKYSGFSEFKVEGSEENYSFEDMLEGDDDLLEKLDIKVKYEEILNAMNQLENIYKEVLQLKFVEELSYEEIASITGTSNENVRKRLSRAIKSLKELLSGNE